jgi:hypothetical protein
MKIKVRPADAGKDGWPPVDDWSQMDDWLAGLRDDDRAGPPGSGHAAGDGVGSLWPATLAQADARAPARAETHAEARAPAVAEARARDDAADRAEAIERAVIGDQLRIPVIWCEMGSCISWYADPAALGEADTRARAIGTGWRVDALGRLACRQCQQTDPCFWASRPVVPWDRHAAIARAAKAAAMPAAGPAHGATDGAGLAVAGWQRQYPQVR